MIKTHEQAIERFSVAFQVLITIACFFIALWDSGALTSEIHLGSKEYLISTFAIGPIWFGLLDIFELGSMKRIQRFRELLKKYIITVSAGAFLLIVLIEILDYKTITNIIVLKFALFNFFVLSSQKILGRSIMKFFRQKGLNTRMILVIADETTIPFINQIIQTNEWGYIIRGIITDSKKVRKRFGDKFLIYQEDANFVKIIDEMIIDEVFFCQQHFKTHQIRRQIAQCRDIGVSFHIHNNVLSFSGLTPSLSYLNHEFLLSFKNTPTNYLALKFKGTFDFFLTILILIFVSPVLLTISILIKLEDGGPVLFKQTRVGRNGRLFKCFKFRTMVINAEDLKEKLMAQNEQEGPVFKMKNDPRITKVGRFLRKTSLDELPQFFNVILGDMAIVGPRPPIPSEVEQYERSLTRRLSINPGITCIWQVSGRNNIPFDKWMEMDMEYIDNWSLMLDFTIILKTFKVIFTGNGQ